MARRFDWQLGLLLVPLVAGCGDDPRRTASSSDRERAPSTDGLSPPRALDVRLRFEAVGTPAKIVGATDLTVEKKAVAHALDAARPPLVACYAGRPLSTERSDDPGATWVVMRVDETGAASDVRRVRSTSPDESSSCATDVLGKLGFGSQPRPFALSVWIDVSAKPPTATARASSAEQGKSAPPSKASTRPRLPPGSCDTDNVLAYLPICTAPPDGASGDPLVEPLGSSGLTGASGTSSGPGLGGGGRLGGKHRSKAAQVRMGGTTVSGRLPAEVIQRIVRQQFGVFRACYETALSGDPTLSGVVVVKFTILADGSVAGTSHTTTIADPATGECVEKGFHGISFPQPESGVVQVTYPISFNPPETPPRKVTSVLGVDLDKLTGAALATAVTRDKTVATSVDGAPSGDVPFVVFVDAGGEHFGVVRTPRASAQPPSAIALLGDDFWIHVFASGAAKPTTKFLE